MARLLIYLIARGRSKGERQLAAAGEMQSHQETYIRQVAGSFQGAREPDRGDESLADSEAITPSEFDELKAKTLG